MEFLDKISQLLRKPFPEEESRFGHYRNITIISVFVAFFLYIFQPFGIATVPTGKFFICLGFGMMTFIGTVVFDFIVNQLLHFKGEREQFTFGKWMLNIFGIMLTISLANFLFARSLFGTIRWEFFPQMLYGTFTVGIIPVVILGAISLLRQEKKYLNIADEINQKKDRYSNPSTTSDTTIFNIPTSQIRYIEALQNYVKIGYVSSNGQLQEQTERATLKGILDETQGCSIVRCHRSFLVNRDSINTISGNAQGLLLSVSDCDKMIPVSRSFVPVFRNN
jgi:two-component system, LytTR family, response regulator